MVKILYIDDEKDFVESLPVLLEEKGLKVIAFIDIDQGLAALEKELFDLVLLDIMMPPKSEKILKDLPSGRRTGIEVAKLVKKIKPEIPIVVFTVLPELQIMHDMKKEGVVATRVIRKPSEIDEIAEALLRACPGKK